MLSIVEDDITEIKVQYIAHQCNATHNRNFGLASKISKKFPFANIYCGKNAVKDRKPGTIIVKNNVIAMIAQVNQGQPKSGVETKKSRELLFNKCLKQISAIKDIQEVAFPFGIGCGYAGGDWDSYFDMIIEFSEENPNINVILVRYTE